MKVIFCPRLLYNLNYGSYIIYFHICAFSIYQFNMIITSNYNSKDTLF